jgi:RNA polymerase sigma-70 factor (ECF subfamily)
VLQEAYLQMTQRLEDYLRRPAVSAFVWMRQQTLQTLIDLQRGHFREKRSPHREVQFSVPAESDGTSVAMAHFLVAEMTSPSGAAVKAEEAVRIREALDSMQELDREVLAMRHFELLGNQEVAEALGVSVSAASNRYVRAMARLTKILAELEGGDASAERAQ